MKKILVLTHPPIIKYFWGYDTIIVREHLSKMIRYSRRTKIIIIPEDLLSGVDMRMGDHLTFINEEIIYKSHFLSTPFKYLENFGGKNFSRYFVGRSLSEELLKIVRSIQFSKKVVSHFNISGKVYLYSGNISGRVFNMSRKILPEMKTSEFLFIRKYEMFLNDVLKSIGRAIIATLFPFKTIFKVKNNSLNLKSHYKVGVHLYPGLGFYKDQPMDFFIEKEKLLKKDVLFIVDYLFDDNWEKQVRETEYNIINFQTELLPSLSKPEYLFNYLPRLLCHALIVSKLILFYPWLSSQLYKHLQAFLYWNIFFDKSKMDYSMRAMTKGDLTSIAIQKIKKVETIFVYFSTTSQIINQKLDNTKSDCSDYTYMIFDKVVSSRMSNEWIDTLQNDITHFVGEKPIPSNFVHEKISFRSKSRKLAAINDTQIVISCFDHSLGYGGMLNYEAYHKFLNDLFRLQDLFPEHLFCIKTKKNWEYLLNIRDHRIHDILKNINDSTAWLNAKDYSLSTYDWIGLSDLVISAPVSSVIFESYFGGIETISYDPLNQYNQEHRPAEKIDNLSAHSYDELVKLFNMKIKLITKINKKAIYQSNNEDYSHGLFN